MLATAARSPVRACVRPVSVPSSLLVSRGVVQLKSAAPALRVSRWDFRVSSKLKMSCLGAVGGRPAKIHATIGDFSSAGRLSLGLGSGADRLGLSFGTTSGLAQITAWTRAMSCTDLREHIVRLR